MKCLLLLPLTVLVSQANAGTIFFHGALVEPTCQAEVVGEPTGLRQATAELMVAERSGLKALRLSDCRASAALAPSTSTPTTGQALAAREVVRPVDLLELSTPVSELAGRASVDTVTVSYL